MKILFIINDAPYGTEKAYNAFPMAMSHSTMSQFTQWTVEADKVLTF
jgi:sulfur relay (sulfurtransferase) complex TusBCD TusD component (DsrE family)